MFPCFYLIVSLKRANTCSTGGLADSYLLAVLLFRSFLSLLLHQILHARPVFFFCQRARLSPSHDYKLTSVCRATSAAPALFPPARIESVDRKNRRVCIDGGVIANNPTLAAVHHVLANTVRPAPHLLCWKCTHSCGPCAGQIADMAYGRPSLLPVRFSVGPCLGASWSERHSPCQVLFCGHGSCASDPAGEVTPHGQSMTAPFKAVPHHLECCSACVLARPCV